MEKAQIREITKEYHDAGSKATADIARIAAEEGFACFDLKQDTQEESIMGKLLRQKGYIRDLRTIRKNIPQGAIVLLQHPFHHRQISRDRTLKELKEKKNCRFICVVHDVEELRGYRYNEYYAQEFKTMLETADQLIVHNTKMKEWFQSTGVPEEKLISLECFDYLIPEAVDPAEQKDDKEESICVAGNLDPDKSGYILELGKTKGIRIHLYGPNCPDTLKQRGQIRYHGSVPPDELPGRLEGRFGLVWDGYSAESCMGEAGNYLKYNHPHKLSLYLASGIPVIIWEQSAAAEFVREQGVGLITGSIKEAEEAVMKVSEAEYAQMRDRANKTGAKLRSGAYFRSALAEAIMRIRTE